MEFRLSLPVQSNFFFGYVPNVLKARFRRERSRGKFIQIENYLDKINLGYNIIDILDTLVDTMSTVIEGRYVLYRVGDNRPFKDTKYTLNQLLNLIEYGNLEVRGARIIKRIFNELSFNERRYYSMYLANKGVV